MIDLDVLDKQCPKCCGLGRIENPVWYPIWATRSDLKDSFQILENKEKLTLIETSALNTIAKKMPSNL